MIPEKLTQLVELLTEKTRKKQAVWNKVSGNNQFKLSIAEGVSITINEWNEQYNDDSYEVVIFNSNGDPIQRYMTGEDTSSSEHALLAEFHKTASDQYFKVDETMDALLTSITGSEVIGKLDSEVPNTSSPGEDDDLPF